MFGALAPAAGKVWSVSTAPMSTPPPRERAKPGPRWSVARPAGLAPASAAGLLGGRAYVRVGPPLSAKGNNMALPLTLLAPVTVAPEVSLIRLKFAATEP